MLATANPFPFYPDLDGDPMNGGKLFYGVANQNPETAPVQVYWDAAGTQPAAQPIRTLNGYAVRSGTPALVYIDTDYSLSVRNNRGVLLYYSASSATFSNDFSLQTQITALVATFTALASSVGSALVGWIQAGASAVARLLQDKVREIEFSANDFGADPTGVANSDAAVLAAVTAIGTSGVPTTLVLSGKLKLTKRITLDVSKIALRLKNCELDFTGLTDTEAIVITGPGTGTTWDFRQKSIISGNGLMRGPGTGSGKTGILYSSATDIGPSHVGISDITVETFGVGEKYLSNAYIITHHNCLIQGNGTNVWMPSGGTNYGERITYEGCCISTATVVGIKNDNGNGGAFYLIGTSVDYNFKQIELTNGGQCYAIGSHIEGNDFPGISPITIAGSGGYFVMKGGVLTHLAAVPQSHLSIVNVDVNSIAVFDDVFMNNLRNTAAVFATGAGRVFIDGHQTFAATGGMPDFVGSSLNFNLMADPGFETTPLVDDWCVSSDTASITSRTAGTNISFGQHAGGHTGSDALRIFKTTAATNGALSLFYPAGERKRYAFNCWYQKPVTWTTGGNLSITLYYAKVWWNSAGVPVITQRVSAGAIVIPLAAATIVAWTQTANVAPGTLPPSWATHVMVEFNLFDFGGVTLDLDDAILTGY